MVIYHVTYTPREGCREAFLAKLEELQVAQKSRAEEGNLGYAYYFPADGGEEIFLVERWESAAAQEAHTHSVHFQALGKIKGDYIADTCLQIYEAQLSNV
ncbi:MAG: antibiotic biosynthesis monooxygenase [Lachnospiraceae bacterium]|nr:antibiotic biosynthesis monooxygenase [Lachnospiraceae bacterium]